MPDIPNFVFQGDTLPVTNFNAISGHHYLNRRSIIFLLEYDNGDLRRCEYCFEVANDTQSLQIDSLTFGIGRAPYLEDATPSSDYSVWTLSARSSSDFSIPINYAYRIFDEEGHLLRSSNDATHYGEFTAGVWENVLTLDSATDNHIKSVHVEVNNSARITTPDGNKKPLEHIPDGVPINFDNFGTHFTTTAEQFLANVNGVPIGPTDDHDYGETSGPGGGQGGSFDNSSDAIDFSPLPTGGAAASGLVTMYHPTSNQMAAFGNFLWGSLFESGFDGLLTSLKKWVNDPIESIIQLAAFPVTPPTGGAKTVKFCGISSDLVGTGVTMNTVTSQFMSFDFGSITVPAYWKQALDYTPYSKVSIFLPFCGIQPLNADDIIDATLHLKYNIDLLTGIFSAELKVTKTINGTPLNSVLYNWSGNMAVQIPITASNFSQVFGSLMSTVAAAGIGAISGGLGAAAAGAETTATAGALSGAGHGIAANIGNVVNSKPHVQHGGRLDGSAGSLSSFTPYLIIERPVQSLSANFQKEQGYPSNIVQRLGDLSGMTVCEAPILDGIPCTDNERQMLYNLLCGGVII